MDVAVVGLNRVACLLIVVVRAQLNIDDVVAEGDARSFAQHQCPAVVPFPVVESHGARIACERVVGPSPSAVSYRRRVHHHSVCAPHPVHVVVCGGLLAGLLVVDGF